MAYLSADTIVPQMSRGRLKRMLAAGNRLTLVIGAWALIWPRPYFLLVALCLALPLLAVAADASLRGTIDWVRRRNAAPFPVATIATLPALALSVRVLTDFNILNWWMMIAWSVLGAICIAGGICMMDTRARENLNRFGQVALFGIAYGYGALAMSNIVLDPHHASETRTEIVDMRVHVSGGAKGGSIWHEVKVDPSASPEGAAWIHVRPDVYGGLYRGEPVCVHSGRGLFAVRWFDVRFCSIG